MMCLGIDFVGRQHVSNLRCSHIPGSFWFIVCVKFTQFSGIIASNTSALFLSSFQFSHRQIHYVICTCPTVCRYPISLSVIFFSSLHVTVSCSDRETFKLPNVSLIFPVFLLDQSRFSSFFSFAMLFCISSFHWDLLLGSFHLCFAVHVCDASSPYSRQPLAF